MNTPVANSRKPFGEQLREWRQRRHLSQLDLAAQVEISTRHLSFVETGRSQPSRAMVLEALYPADEFTAEVLRGVAASAAAAEAAPASAAPNVATAP